MAEVKIVVKFILILLSILMFISSIIFFFGNFNIINDSVKIPKK